MRCVITGIGVGGDVLYAPDVSGVSLRMSPGRGDDPGSRHYSHRAAPSEGAGIRAECNAQGDFVGSHDLDDQARVVTSRAESAGTAELGAGAIQGRIDDVDLGDTMRSRHNAEPSLTAGPILGSISTGNADAQDEKIQETRWVNWPCFT